MALEEAAADDPQINLRSFECLGACDIAPMVSVDQAFYGPLGPGDAERLVEDLRAGRDPIPELALALRKSTDPNAGGEGA
jgi:(2Fe-2S) ferredoxin